LPIATFFLLKNKTKTSQSSAQSARVFPHGDSRPCEFRLFAVTLTTSPRRSALGSIPRWVTQANRLNSRTLKTEYVDDRNPLLSHRVYEDAAFNFNQPPARSVGDFNMEVYTMSTPKDLLASTKTLTGVSLSDLPALLDEELPKGAYKAIPGATYLTDIDPAFMRDKFNQLFGLSGYGWGYSYSAESVSLSKEDVVRKKGQSNQYTEEIYFAQLLELTFWYKLVEDEKITRHEIPATGASDNKVAAYALKGAITAALGNAASNIGWQKSVYMGKRSHKTVGKSKKSPSSNGTAKKMAKPTQKPTSKPTPKKVAPKPAPAKLSAEEAELGAYLIPTGPKSGQALVDQNLKALTFYAKKMRTGGDEDKKALKEAASAFLVVRSNGSQPASVAA
jgi:hypothetical protein